MISFVRPKGFNTDDGIWRATILFGSRSGFEFCRFNTDDGIWRATMQVAASHKIVWLEVSIPMTVFGGLQFMEVAHDNVYYEKFQYR